jgi:ABC-2 type transport system permease protein
MTGAVTLSIKEAAIRHFGIVLRSVKEAATRHSGIVLLSIKEKLAYRFDFFTSLASTLITTALLRYLWVAIYQQSTSIDMPLQSLITYVSVGQVIGLSRISWAQRRPAYRIAGGIRSGGIVLDLIRPVDYQLLQLSDALGLLVAELLLINSPAFILSLLFLRISPPVSLEATLGFVASLMGAFLLGFSMNYLVSMMAFWTINTHGLLYAKKALTDILAGSIIPFALLPAWLRRIALLLPFQGMAHLPLSIYVGTVSGPDIWTGILKQLGWAMAMLLLTRAIWLGASRKITVHGG